MRDNAALRVRGLVKRYGAFTAVDAVDITVERGQAYGLLGPNGSGKTTTLSCVLGLLEATAGNAEVLGVPSRRLHDLQGRLACVFDSPALLPGHTLMQNLAYHRRLRGHVPEPGHGLTEARALELVGLGDLARRRASNLSLGQKKRLSLAAALAGEPELIVLDEPLSGLDPMGVRDIMHLFQELVERGITLVVSSHRLHEMQELLTHCAVIHRGRVLHEGPLEGLLGDDRTVHVRVDDTQRARGALAAIGAVSDAPEGGLLVQSVRGDAPRVARTIVEAGVGLLSLAPQRRGLQAAFEALVDADLARRGERRKEPHLAPHETAEDPEHPWVMPGKPKRASGGADEGGAA
jgi:ABC-type multidrug transport system ATPase subunit